MATKMSPQEADISTKMATHDALIDLGKQLALKEAAQKKKISDREKIIKQIQEIDLDKVETYFTRQTKADRIKQLKTFKDYIKFSEEALVEAVKEASNYKQDYEDINFEMDELVKECDQKDEEMKSVKAYYENRVLKLRQKCIARNSTISMFKYWLILSIGITWCLSTFGVYYCFNQVVNVIEQIMMNIYLLVQIIIASFTNYFF